MTLKANNPDEYVMAVDEARREAFSKLRETILANIPPDFREEMSYGMIGYVVPHTLYPKGYHLSTLLRKKTTSPYITWV